MYKRQVYATELKHVLDRMVQTNNNERCKEESNYSYPTANNENEDVEEINNDKTWGNQTYNSNGRL